MFAKQVVEQSLRLQNLIDQLLQLSRLEQRQQLDSSHTCSLMQCAQQAIEGVRSSAAQRQISLHLQGVDSHGPWEAGLVQLAISNLLQNALDFSPNGSAIELTLAAHQVTVRDHGPGVPEAILGRLGERFFTTARPNGERSGTGLGLSIARWAAQLHGGTVKVVDDTRGADFEIILPKYHIAER